MTHRKVRSPVGTSPALAQLSDADLAAARDRALQKLTPRARVAALAMHAGKPASGAAGEAGLSTHPSAVSRLQDRIEPALALLREEARRASKETQEGAAAWFDGLAMEARQARDFSAAVRAKREACLLRGQYPDPRLRVEHELIDSREVTAEEIEALARLRHEVRPRLGGGVVEAEFAPVTTDVTPFEPSLSPDAAQAAEIAQRSVAGEAIPESEAVESGASLLD